MKRIVIVICTVQLLTLHLSAQRGGGRPGPGIGRPSPGIGRLGQPAFTRGGFGGPHFAGHRFQPFGGAFAGGFPVIYPAWNDYYGWPGDFVDDIQPQPNIFIVMAPPPAPAPEPPPPPPPPPTPVVQEYHWATSPNPPEPFSIVLNDGTVHYATMAWVQSGRLYFNVPQGGAHQVPLSAVSRTDTEAANARKNLKLPLP